MLEGRWEYFLDVSHSEPGLQEMGLAGLSHQSLDVVGNHSQSGNNFSSVSGFADGKELCKGKNYVKGQVR